MSQTNRTVSRDIAHRPSQQSSLPGVVSITLATLKEISGFAPVLALRQATDIAIVLLESVQVRTNPYIVESLAHRSS